MYNYVQNIKPKPGHNSPGDLANLASARERRDNRQKEQRTARQEALTDFNEDDNPSKKSNFAEWAVINAPGFIAAQNAFFAAVQEVQQWEDKVFGPGRAALQKASMGLQVATTGTTFQDGYNMNVSSDSITINADGVPNPIENISKFIVPLWTIPNYSATLSGWVANTSAEPSAYTINLAKGEHSSYKDLGHTGTGASVSVSRPVFGFFVKGGSSHSHANFNFSRDAKNVNITLTIKHHKTFPFQPGQWNNGVADLVKTIDAIPPKTEKRVRATQALFAHSVGMKITFSGDAKTAFSKDYKTTIGGGGGITIFGITIGASASSQHSTGVAGSTWDESSGTLTVTPTNSAYESDLLAVMGEVVEI
ncbi:hypothetical protein BGZ60DRAFT_424437 [Tricladium varicosporioides]|nr:hypothetical protein BGZ60DRAFT_424437 [Hymenoscyphus varicosporioides]